MTDVRPPPSSILIIGAGVFGLSTFHALLTSPRYRSTTLILLDPFLPPLSSECTASSSIGEGGPTQPWPNHHASSIDSSRIIRADYANDAYTRLAEKAQEKWRAGWPFTLSVQDADHSNVDTRDEPQYLHNPHTAQKVYTESGLLVTASGDSTYYVKAAQRNCEIIGQKTQTLPSTQDIRDALHIPDKGHGRSTVEHGSAGGIGDVGYANYSSGWADAGAAMAGLMDVVLALAHARNKKVASGSGEGEVVFQTSTARRLLFSSSISTPPAPAGKQTHAHAGTANSKPRVTGAELADGTEIHADVTVLAAGAWSASLLDLRGRVEARGQVLAYLPLTEEEASMLAKMPVVLNLGTGWFAIPPSKSAPVGMPAGGNDALPQGEQTRGERGIGGRQKPSLEGAKGADWHLKIARHAFGYANPTAVDLPVVVDADGSTIAHPPAPPPESPLPFTPPSSIPPSTAARIPLPLSPTPPPSLITYHPATISLPSQHFSPIPSTDLHAARTFLHSLIPASSLLSALRERAWQGSRLCWYADTPSCDFVVDWWGGGEGCLAVTGGSGHGFKFGPVMGGLVQGRLEERWGVGEGNGNGNRMGELADLWKWPVKAREGDWWAEDGSRGGEKGMILPAELRTGRAVGQKGHGGGKGEGAGVGRMSKL